MKLRCPDLNCTSSPNPDPKARLVVRHGRFLRTSDSRYIPRYRCKVCGKSFSTSTDKPSIYQKRRRITAPLKLLLNSGVSQRRAAIILKVNRKTVVRRFRYLAHQERLIHQAWVRNEYRDKPLSLIQFDDLETAEHTKCKPLSVSLAIDPIHRKIVSFKVSQMPAKGHLAKIAVKKYGYREDQRPIGWDQMMKELVPIVTRDAKFCSDENPHYPKYLFKHHPECLHETTIGGRGSIIGQGELKKLKFDPLFSLNHTCAMLRANLNRLFRRTWCISKNKQGLIDHLSLYVNFHNQRLTPQSTGLGASS